MSSTPVPPANAPVAPPAPPSAPPSASPTSAIATVEQDWANAIAAARAEYLALKPEVQGMFHKMLNDIESTKNVSLGALHGLFHAGNATAAPVTPPVIAPPAPVAVATATVKKA